ncbi:MAG: DUF721 domain-containing protein [Schleiferiaceae bacterium]|jgi:predicted nucleic acid-binding Zn ribbon protein|nr:DUF721 domain-containing protein [Schleiferiaceae bacterium]MDR9443186.1 DUF721 domain-containing protein [Schleiferiaceae bacterium]
MKKQNEVNLGEAIRDFIRRNELDDKLLETEIYQRWEELAGKAVNLKTREVRYWRGRLVVRVSSPALRQELQLRREALREQINQRLKNRPVETLEIR